MIIEDCNCIVGLGNPGIKYSGTRHNIGFRIIDRLTEFFERSGTEVIFSRTDDFISAKTERRGKTIFLIKPLTYMNLSGIALRKFLDENNVPFSNILVVYDDINIGFGVLRIRPSGSDGGHNGMSSVIYELQTEEIPRLRVGIGNAEEMEKFRTADGLELANYVLTGFTDEEKKELDRIIDLSRDAAICFIEDGIDRAMSLFNRDHFGDSSSLNINSKT